MWPQKGIQYFTAGGAGKLNRNDTHASDVTEVGFATDRSFMIVEVAGDTMFFQAISGGGTTIDKGALARHLGPGSNTVATTPPPGPATVGPATPATATPGAAPANVTPKPVAPKKVVKKKTTVTKTPPKTTTTTKKTTTKKPVPKPVPATKPVPGTPLAS
jgi:outer membrane biosynthesis protein TonB